MNDRKRAVLRAGLVFAGVFVFSHASPAQAAGQGTNGPIAKLSATLLTFSSQLATTTSPAQMVTLTNAGGQALAIASITLNGTFSQTNNCPVSGTLAPSASCSFSVSFVAPNGGPTTQPGFIEISDNANPPLQVISLSGTVADFTLAASTTTQTVSAGSSAAYMITITGTGGFNQAVYLTCGALPTGASCSFSPGSITAGSSPVTDTLTVSTSAGSFAPLRHGPARPWIPTVVLLGLAGLLALRFRARRTRPLLLAALAMLLTAAVVAPGCGGGGSSSGGGGIVATPPGTYSVLINGTPTAGPSSLTNPLVLKLVVQ